MLQLHLHMQNTEFVIRDHLCEQTVLNLFIYSRLLPTWANKDIYILLPILNRRQIYMISLPYPNKVI